MTFNPQINTMTPLDPPNPATDVIVDDKCTACEGWKAQVRIFKQQCADQTKEIERIKGYEDYIPKGYYVAEDLDGERLVKADDPITICKWCLGSGEDGEITPDHQERYPCKECSGSGVVRKRVPEKTIVGNIVWAFDTDNTAGWKERQRITEAVEKIVCAGNEFEAFTSRLSPTFNLVEAEDSMRNLIKAFQDLLNPL